jgi:hypothetical protein
MGDRFRPTWHNPAGFTLRDTLRKVNGFPPWRKRTLYEYQADAQHPLTVQFAEHGFVRPDRHGFTDMGSVPEVAQLVVPKDLHLASFIIHDSGYREHGLYVSSTLDGLYTFAPLSRARVDRLLREMLRAAGYPHRARLVWAAVWAGGRFCW